MDSSVCKALEYPKIVTLLADKAGSVMAKEIALNLTPTAEREEVEKRLQETAEALEVLIAAATVPLGGIRDIRAAMKRAEIGAMLEPQEMLAIGSTLYAARRIKNFFAEYNKPLSVLEETAAAITILRNLENTIENTITEQGQVRDDASVELARLRREIRTAQSRVKEKIEHILHSGEYQKYFQDALVTVRGDRYVIPIKQEYRHQFPGIVHDQSASGSTVFIEPMAVVQLNNDMKQAMAAEKNEIERILTQVSAQIAAMVEAIRRNCTALAQLDFAFAKARLSLEMSAEKPIVNQKGHVRLIGARHPLIPKEVVVPIDVHLGKEFTTLLITGPNTGGKTVSLKTVGLFSLMIQSGLFIPAKATSEMPLFQNIFADIGDEQSIEQSLSTFSGHMTNLVRILRQVTAHDLVLIDEIGSGTDPGEGAALAMAILEYLHNLGTRTIATTHYSELKTFAYSRQGIENASVEFNIETLRPTYRLLIGVPGSSNAFNISLRLGLSQPIISRAKELLDEEHAEFEAVLAALDAKQREYAKRSAEIQVLEREVTALREVLTREKEQLETKRRDILAKAQEQAGTLIRQARRDAEGVITELKAQFSVNSEKERQTAISGARKKLQQGMSALYSDDDQADMEDENIPQPDDLEAGMLVYVTTLKQKGTVLAVGRDEVTVQLGIMKINVPLVNCRLISEAPQPRKVLARQEVNVTKVQQISREIDIRGTTVMEAEELLNKYIDDAILAGLAEVRIIHGKGTGALRKGIRNYLTEHPHIKDIRFGDMNEGGDGVTVAQLL